MGIGSRLTAQRSGIALAALLVTSMSVHDHRVAAALQQGVSVTGSSTVRSQPAPLVATAYDSIGSGIAHHYPPL